MMTQHWWEKFFTGEWAQFVTQVDDAQTRREAALLRVLLKLRPGMSVLDVPCGGGRLTLALAAQGIVATGVDQSSMLLERAQRESTARHLPAEWAQADMRQLPWVARFDAAYCFWGSFGYFEDEGNASALRSVAQALRPGGRFLLDTPVVETLLPRLSSGLFLANGGLVSETCTFDPETARVESDWTLVRAGRVRTGHTSIRLYTLRELKSLLHDCGFERLTAFDGQTGGPFRFGAERLALVGTRGAAGAA